MSDIAQLMRAANPVPDKAIALPDDEFDALLLLTQVRSGKMETQQLQTPVEPEKKNRGWLTAAAAFAAVVVAGFVIALVANAGGGSEQDVVDTPPTTQALSQTTVVEALALHLTFDGESCTYEGATELTQGPVALTFVNESEVSAAVNLSRIEEGHTIQDLIDDIGPEPGTEEAPSWMRHLGTWRPIAPGESYLWEEDLAVGLYAMVCAHFSVEWPYAVWFGTGLTVAS